MTIIVRRFNSSAFLVSRGWRTLDELRVVAQSRGLPADEFAKAVASVGENVFAVAGYLQRQLLRSALEQNAVAIAIDDEFLPVSESAGEC